MSDLVSISVGGKTIDLWNDYDISTDLLTPADSFNLRIAPATEEIFDLCAPDSEIEVRINDAVILTGFVDDRDLSINSGRGSSIQISGRDRIGRLVDESPEPVQVGKRSLQGLAEEIAGDWFSEVVFSNAKNRDLMRGRRSGKAAPGTEPIVEDPDLAPKIIEPGEKRWDVLAFYLERAGLLAWSSADGKSLIIGKPNYTQETQFRFELGQNIEDLKLKDSVRDLFSEIQVYGSARGDSDNFGDLVSAVKATATSDLFQRDKKLIVPDDSVENKRDAERAAAREMTTRKASYRSLEIAVAGHSQKRAKDEPAATFALDTIAAVKVGPFVTGKFAIVGARYARSGDGTSTELSLVPVGTELSL